MSVPTIQLETSESWRELRPHELAEHLSHLPGLVLLDSAGNVPEGSHPALSLVAARPTRTLTGSIDDCSALAEELAKHATAPRNDAAIPTGALIGCITYEGNYHFGVYPELLVFDHHNQRWHETGTLSRELRPPNPKPAPQPGQFRPAMPREDYENAVGRIHDYIAAGDIYQVNLCQQFSCELTGEGSLFPLYEHLRSVSPAPMAAYLDLGDTEILSSSPETFLRFSGRQVETRPIKGTRPRFRDPEADQRSAYELRTSEKEISELIMITDLLRNDLGQVSEFGSVHVTELLKLEKFEQVYHLVSTVRGTLREEISQLEALRACFPGGSITGAPKKRAMEIIDELEGTPRGLYTGAIGYFGFNGESQFNIAIRTLVREGDSLHYHVGAGIVADSTPEAEYHETLHKAEGMRQAITSWQNS